MRNDENLGILIELMKNRAPDKGVRLFLRDKREIDVIVDCLTYVTIDDDEDVPAVRFLMIEDGEPVTLIGADIKRYEYLKR